MVVAAFVNQYAPSQRGLLRSGTRRNVTASTSSSHNNYNAYSIRFPNEKDVVNVSGKNDSTTAAITTSDRSSQVELQSASVADVTEEKFQLRERKKNFRAIMLLTSMASDFDLISDWWFYYVMMKREREFEKSGRNLIPDYVLYSVLASCIVGTLGWLILATDGRVITPFLKLLNIDGLSLGYVLIACVFVEDIPQMFFSFLVEEYYENDKTINNYAVMNMMTSCYDLLIKLAEAYDERNDIVETGAWCKKTFYAHKDVVSTIVTLPPHLISNNNNNNSNQSILFHFSDDQGSIDEYTTNTGCNFMDNDNHRKTSFLHYFNEPSLLPLGIIRKTMKQAQDMTPYFLSGSWDGTIRFWDPSIQKKNVRTFRSNKGGGPITSITVLGKNVIGYENFIPHKQNKKRRNILQTSFRGNLQSNNQEDEEKSHSIFFLSGSKDGSILLWNLNQQRPVRTFASVNSQLYVTSLLCFKEENNNVTSLFVSTHTNGTAQLWCLESGQRLRIYRGHMEWKRISASCSFGNYSFLTASEDCDIRLWDAFKTPKSPSDKRAQFAQDNNATLSMSNNHNNENATMIHDEIENVWNSQKVYSGHNAAVFAITMVSSQKAFVSGSADRTARLWSLDGPCLRIFQGHLNAIRSVSTFDQGTILTGSHDRTVKLWDAHTGICLRTYDDHTGYITSVTNCNNGMTFLTSSEDRTIKLWVVTSSTIIDTLDE